jgi:putative membrane protein
MMLSVGAILIAVYLMAARAYEKLHQHAWPRACTVGFCCGVALGVACFSSRFDRLADASFSWHMAQHLVLIFIAVPLVLAGRPLLLLLGCVGRISAKLIANAIPRRVAKPLSHPVVGWLFFVAVLWGTHFSPLYERALERSWVHAAEHIVYVIAAIAFWQNVVRPGPSLWTLGRPLQAAYVFTAIPAGAFLGLAIQQSRHPFYPHYVFMWGSRALALADQRDGGALMWLGGGLILFVVFLSLIATWAAEEQQLGASDPSERLVT